jgi:hypothetical protein
MEEILTKWSCLTYNRTLVNALRGLEDGGWRKGELRA